MHSVLVGETVVNNVFVLLGGCDGFSVLVFGLWGAAAGNGTRGPEA